MIYILLFFMITLFFITFLILNKDITHPSVLLCMSYIIAILSAIVNIDVWDINIHYNTIVIIVIGALVFIITSFLVEHVCKNLHKYESESLPILIKPIYIQPFKTVIICVVGLVVVYIYYKTIINISLKYGTYDNFAAMMTSFRQTISYNVEESIPIWLNQFVKITNVCAMVYTYVFIHNIIAGYKNKLNFINLLPVAIFVLQTILTSGRSNLLVLLCGTIVIVNILWHRKNGWNKTVGLKFISKAMIFVVIAFLGFYFIKGAVGRTDKTDAITYLTSYAGGSIQLLDMYLQDDSFSSSYIFGKETFYAINKTLIRSKIVDAKPYIIHLEFRSSNGVDIGNVYTSYRRWIHDFGYVGMIILQFLEGLIFSIFYNKVKRNISKHKIDYQLLVYAMISFAIILHSINDYFFPNIISINYVTSFIILWIACWFIVEKKFAITWNGKHIV